MGVEFDLAWTVDDEVVVLVRAELVVQPVEVVEQVPKRKCRREDDPQPAVSTRNRLPVCCKETYSKQYISPPFGPNSISSMTSSRLMRSLMSIVGGYSNSVAAGSRLNRWIWRLRDWAWAMMDAQNVDLPDPAGPVDEKRSGREQWRIRGKGPRRASEGQDVGLVTGQGGGGEHGTTHQ